MVTAGVGAIEGTRTYGTGLVRVLQDLDELVIEVDRPRHPPRRNGVKTDEIDAARCAREALSNIIQAQPRSGPQRDALALLLAARDRFDAAASCGDWCSSCGACGVAVDDVVDGVLVIDSAIETGRRSGSTVLSDAPTKTANQRRLTLDAATLAVVEGERKKRAEFGPWMFAVGDDPPNPDRIGFWWRLAREKAGVDAKWRLHDLRHWSASVAIAAGHDVKTVADRLGHANAAMTLRVYAHAFAKSDRAVADSVGALLASDE